MKKSIKGDKNRTSSNEANTSRTYITLISCKSLRYFLCILYNSLSHSDTVHKKCKCVLQQLFFCFFKLFGQLPPSQIGKDIAFESGLSLLVNK